MFFFGSWLLPSPLCLLPLPSFLFFFYLVGNNLLPLPYFHVFLIFSCCHHLLICVLKKNLRFDGMKVILEKLFYLIELPLKVDCCSFRLLFVVFTSILTMVNSTITNVAQQWALLAK
jgi:hypothetical protein